MGRQDVGTAPFQIRVPDGAEPFDVPGDLASMATQISALLAQAGLSDAAFAALLEKFVAANGQRVEGTTTSVGGTFDGGNAWSTSTDLGISVTSPPWPSLALIDCYANVTPSGASTVGDAVLAIYANGSSAGGLIAWEEQVVRNAGIYLKTMTLQKIPASAKLTLRAGRVGLTGMTVSTRYMHNLYLRINTDNVPAP